MAANLPIGVTFGRYLAVTIFEGILLFFLLVIAFSALKKYLQNKSWIRLNNMLLCAGYATVLIALVLPKIMRMYGFSEIIDDITLEINKSLIVFTNCLFWIFYTEIFVDSDKKRNYLILYIGISLVFTVISYSVGEYGLYVFIIPGLIMSFLLTIKLYISAKKLASKLRNKSLDKISMKYISNTGLFLTISYMITYSTSALEEMGILEKYSVVYFISAFLGALAFVMFYIGFFQPNWLKIKYYNVELSDNLDIEPILSDFSDNLPQLDKKELTYKSAFEWWYVDLENDDGVSLVTIFKLRDGAVNPKRPMVHIEYKSKLYEFNRLEYFNMDEIILDIDPQGETFKFILGKNSLTINKDKNGLIKNLEIQVNIDNFAANMNIIPDHQGFKIGKNGKYFIHKISNDLYSSVNFAGPKVSGEAKIKLFNEEIQLKGHGYHDHPWGTANLLLTHREWHWGRLSAEKNSVVFAHVFPQKKYYGDLKFLYLGSLGEYKPKLTHDFNYQTNDWKKENKIVFPHKFDIICNDPLINLKLNYKDILSELPVYLRSKVEFELKSLDSNKIDKGVGWLEYFKIFNMPLFLMIYLNRRKMKQWVNSLPKKIGN